MYFTKEAIEEIRKRLSEIGVRDTEIEKLSILSNPLDGTETIVIVKDGVNKRITIEDLYEEYMKYVETPEAKEDFFNVSSYLARDTQDDTPVAVTLEEAIESCPATVRKTGQTIKFLNSDTNKWETYSMEGEDWSDPTSFVQTNIIATEIHDNQDVGPDDPSYITDSDTIATSQKLLQTKVRELKELIGESEVSLKEYVEQYVGEYSGSLSETIVSNTQVGAAAPGTTFTEGSTFTEVLKKIAIAEQSPVITLSGMPAPVIKEEGTLQTIILTATVSKGTANSLDKVAFYNGSTLIEEQTEVAFNTQIICSAAQNITTGTTFKVVITYKDSTSTERTSNKTLTYNYTNYSYWGIVNEGVTPDATIVSAFTNKSLIGNKNTNITSTAAKILVYSYPKSFGALSHIKDSNGYDYITDFYRTELTVDGIAHYCYYQMRVNNNSINFIFS